MRKLSTIILLFVSISLFAQEDTTNLGWKVGLNVGMYQANNYAANFYNGSEDNLNKISLITENFYHYQNIYDILDAADTLFVSGIPTNMKYDPAVAIGFVIRNNFRDDFAWFLQFNQVTLTARDLYTIEVDPKDFATEPDLRSFSVWGKEQRYMIDFGFSKEFPLENRYRAFIDLGVTLTNHKVVENKILVHDKEFSIINIYGNKPYVPNSGMQAYTIEQGGLGYGGFINSGIKLYVNDFFSIDPMVHVYMHTTGLEGYKTFKPHFYFNIRFCVNNLFLFSQRNLDT